MTPLCRALVPSCVTAVCGYHAWPTPPVLQFQPGTFMATMMDAGLIITTLVGEGARRLPPSKTANALKL